MSAMSELNAELAKPDRQIALWWRDDDAVDWTPSLAELLRLHSRYKLPLALAIIPAHMQNSLIERLAANDQIDLLVHGYGHVNHAPPTARKSELGPERDISAIVLELGAGLHTMMSASPNQTIPVLVPPWNRLRPDLVNHLTGLGFKGLSAWGPNPVAMVVPGMVQANTQIDLIDWKNGKTAKTLDTICAELLDEIRRQADSPTPLQEPIGILTHHLQMSEAAFANLEALMSLLSRHSTVHWPSARGIFGIGERAK